MSDSQRNIPSDLKRQVRKACHFGCVICGMPVFHYDHIQEYNVVKEHDFDNLALLCPQHHDDKTHKRLSAERVAYARKFPANATKKSTGVYRIYPSRAIDLSIAGNFVYGSFPNSNGSISIINIFGEDFVKLHCDDGWLSMSCKFTDLLGNIILEINQGEVTVSTGVWDFQFVADDITMNEASRKISLNLKFSDSKFKVETGSFIKNSDGECEGICVKRGSLSIYKNGITKLKISGNKFLVKCPDIVLELRRKSRIGDIKSFGNIWISLFV